VLIHKENIFIQTPFNNEEELENVVIENYEYIFGPNSFGSCRVLGSYVIITSISKD